MPGRMALMSHKGPRAFTCSSTSIAMVDYALAGSCLAADSEFDTLFLMSCTCQMRMFSFLASCQVYRSVADLKHCQVLSMPIWHIALHCGGAKSSIADQSIWGGRKLVHQLLNAIPFALVTKECLQVAKLCKLCPVAP